jgi:hypothetical protein
MTSKANRIYINFLVHGSEQLESGLSHIETILDKMFPGVPRTWLVVDNSVNQSMVQQINPDRWLISGDNSLWEFSGWDHGYKFIRDQFCLVTGDVIIYANDTFHRRAYSLGGISHLDEFNADILRGHDLTQEVIGYLDDFPRSVTLIDIKYDSWLRSNIFMIPADIAERLYPLVFPLSPDEIFSGNMQKFWGETSKISENWKAYISSWLFGTKNPAYPEYRLHWHKVQQVNSDNWEFFKIKARCILSEHYLTARLHDWGVPIIDTNRFEKKIDRHIAPYYE